MLDHKVVDFLGILSHHFCLSCAWLYFLCHFVVSTRLVGSVGSFGETMVGSLSLPIANAASGPSNFSRFATCSERVLMLRLKVDAALTVPVLSNMMCLRPCVGAVNDGFFGVKERCGYRGPPSIFSFLLGSASCGRVAILSLLDV